jgi:hypothetical protein
MDQDDMYTNTLLDTLSTLYESYDTIVDNLALANSRLQQLTDDLNNHEHTQFSPNETLVALFYARKKGKLPRLRRNVKAK